MGVLDGLDGLVGLKGLADGLAALLAQVVVLEAEIQPPIMRLVSIIPPYNEVETRHVWAYSMVWTVLLISRALAMALPPFGPTSLP